ncbi:MAG: hypothetical protein GIKADHBN_02284 [Phycisphaerales bacterium]|nr:hypothetical protein [Phycisphaerales bacterium]
MPTRRVVLGATRWAVCGLVAAGVSAGARAQCGTSVLWHDGGSATAMLATDTTLYVGSPNELLALSMSDPANPVEVSSYLLDGHPLVIDKAGDYLYVALGERGVEIIDITNPAVPVQAFSIAGGTADDLAVANGRLHILWNGGIRTYDVANPASPQFLSTFTPATLRELEARNNIVYACSAGTLYTVDYSSPASPVTRDSEAIPSAAARAMDARPGTVAVISGGNVLFYSVTNPSAISLVSTVSGAALTDPLRRLYCEFGQAGGVPVLYFLNPDWRLDSVSIANPASPQPMPDFAVGYEVVAAPSADRVHGHFGAVLNTFSVSLTADPVFLSGSANLPSESVALLTAGDTVVQYGFNAMVLYDVSSPAAPVLASTLTFPEPGVDADVEGSKAYLLSGDGQLMTYDISNPAAPVLLGQDAFREVARSLDVAGNIAYTLTYNDTLEIYRIADPSDVKRKSVTDVPFPEQIAVTGEHALVLCSDALRVYEIADPAAPVLVHTGPATQHGGYIQMDLKDDLLVTSESSGRIEFLDVTNPANPSVLGWIDAGALSWVVLADSLVVASEVISGDVTLIDAADPSAPVVLPQTLRAAGSIQHGAMAGDVLIGGGAYCGLDGFSLPGLPRVTAQPRSTPVCQGAAQVQLSVEIAEPAGATYRWRRGGFPMIDGVTSWGTTISGTQTATLTLTSPHVQDLALYDCEITNACGTVNTRNALLYPGFDPTVVSQPQDSSCCPAGSVTFSVGWLGTVPGTFQWQAEVPAGSGNWVDISDAEFPRFTIEGATTRFLTVAATPGNTLPDLARTSYRCIITNACDSVTSAGAELIVCGADFDCTGFVDTDDFTAFVLAFEAGTDDADFDGTGFVDTDDFTAFVLAFEAGC